MEKIILTKKQIINNIKNYLEKHKTKFYNQSVVFIGLLDGVLPLTIDFLRANKSSLSELDFMFQDQNYNCTNLKQLTLKNKYSVLLLDVVSLEDNLKLKKCINHIKKYKPKNILIFSLIKYKNFKKDFSEEFDYIYEANVDDKFYGYGIKSNKSYNDFNNLYLDK